MTREQKSVIETFWQRATQAAEQGHVEDARAWLEGIVEVDDQNVDAWLWLADLIPDARERMACYIQVLEAAPGNAQARAGIRKTRRELR